MNPEHVLIHDDYERIIQNEPNCEQNWLDYIKYLEKTRSRTIHPILQRATETLPNSFILWYTRAQYYRKIGDYAYARVIFEIGIRTIKTEMSCRSFYDSYISFEKDFIQRFARNSGLSARYNLYLKSRIHGLKILKKNKKIAIADIRINRNPEDANLWLKRVRLEDDYNQKKILYLRGIEETNNAPKLWIAYSQFFEKNNQIKTARNTLLQAIRSVQNGKENQIIKEWENLELRRYRRFFR